MFFKRKNKKDSYEVIFLNNPDSIYAESFRKIPINLEYSNIDRDIKSIHITSAVIGENKTTIACNLSAAYHELGKKVLLMDLDLRRPKVHRFFNLPNNVGLTDFLIDKIKSDELVQKTIHGIDVITSGPSVPSPHVVLRSGKLKDLFEKLKESYDVIIVDSPPILLVTDSLVISQIVDTTIYIVNQNSSKKPEVSAAMRLLKENNANISGVIVTGKDDKIVHKYYDTY